MSFLTFKIKHLIKFEGLLEDLNNTYLFVIPFLTLLPFMIIFFLVLFTYLFTSNTQ